MGSSVVCVRSESSMSCGMRADIYMPSTTSASSTQEALAALGNCAKGAGSGCQNMEAHMSQRISMIHEWGSSPLALCACMTVSTGKK